MDKEIILEDEEIRVLMPKKAATKGHIIITPKQEYMILEQVPETLISKIFQVSNKISSVLFESLKCHGTNILIQNGVPAGQINPNFSVNIIPRYENDGLNLEWEPKKTEEDSLNTSLQKLKDLDESERDKKILEEKKQKAEKKKDEQLIEDKSDNYLIKSLDRIP